MERLFRSGGGSVSEDNQAVEQKQLSITRHTTLCDVILYLLQHAERSFSVYKPQFSYSCVLRNRTRK